MTEEMSFLHRPQGDIKSTAKIKIYPDGSRKIYAASAPIFGADGWELSNKADSKTSRKRKTESCAEDMWRAKRRAAAMLRDYALCNDFKWFVTLTLDKTKIDRYDIKAVVSKMRTWLDNRVRRKGLKYLLVPELHQDGAIHFHGFFNDCPLDFVDSGTLKVQGEKAPKKPRSAKAKRELLAAGALPVYNLSDWSLGFSTAIQIYGNYRAAVGYVTKYVTKETEKIGGRWYYSGGDLKTPEVEYTDISFRELEAAGAYVLPLPTCALAILEVDGDITGD